MSGRLIQFIPNGWIEYDNLSNNAKNGIIESVGEKLDENDFINWSECLYSLSRNAEIDGTNHIYELTVTGDKTAYFKAGQKIKFTQDESTKYAIITYVETSDGDTILTVYGGADYAISANEITNARLAKVQKPIDNTWAEDKWSISYSLSSYSKENATKDEYYYTGNTFKIYKGGWKVDLFIIPLAMSGGASVSAVSLRLSKSQSSNLDSAGGMFLAGYNNVQAYLNDSKIVNLTSNTDYYVILKNPNYSGHTIGITVSSMNRIILTPTCL